MSAAAWNVGPPAPMRAPLGAPVCRDCGKAFVAPRHGFPNVRPPRCRRCANVHQCRRALERRAP